MLPDKENRSRSSLGSGLCWDVFKTRHQVRACAASNGFSFYRFFWNYRHVSGAEETQCLHLRNQCATSRTPCFWPAAVRARHVDKQADMHLEAPVACVAQPQNAPSFHAASFHADRFRPVTSSPPGRFNSVLCLIEARAPPVACSHSMPPDSKTRAHKMQLHV